MNLHDPFCDCYSREVKREMEKNNTLILLNIIPFLSHYNFYYNFSRPMLKVIIISYHIFRINGEYLFLSLSKMKRIIY